jgi:hypothetical protein
MSNGNPAIIDLYNYYRTAKYNVKYVSIILSLLRKTNFIIDVSLAITAPSSAISGIWFWQTDIGSELW